MLGEAIFLAQAPPLNDDFENRIVLTGSSEAFTGTLQNATIQTGEPIAVNLYYAVWPYGYYANRQSSSVWWSWTSSTSEPVTVEVLNSSTNEFKLGGIDVWTGTNGLSNLTFVAGTSLDTGRHPFLTFSGTNGITYHLRVVGTNHGDFTLKLTKTNIPIFIIQPFSRTVSTNGSVMFSALAIGNPPFAPRFTYQWRFNGVDLPGETFPILGLDNLTTNQSGSYSVVVSNAVGGVLSDTAILNVTDGTASPQLKAFGSTNGQFAFEINGEPGRSYRVLSSTNLVNWSEEKISPAEFFYYSSSSVRQRNGVAYASQSPLVIAQTTQRIFYRTTNYEPPLPACINNLARIRAAKEMWTLEQKAVSTPVLSDIMPYFKSASTICPLAGTNGTFATSYIINNVRVDPFCTISFGHILEEPEQ